MNRKTFREYINIIGTRVKLYRINAQLTQQDLADKSGVSVRSISRLEQGSSVQLESLVRVLIALNLDENLELLIPDQTRRPSYYLNDGKNNKKRVRKGKETRKDTGFKWGDEK